MPQTISNIDQQRAIDAAPFAGAFAAAGTMLRKFLAHVRQEAWIRREIARAQALDDHILADMALERREIKHAVRSGRRTIDKVPRDG
jgi:hypothetical protein